LGEHLLALALGTAHFGEVLWTADIETIPPSV
jgi:hypothetical protein